MAVLLRYSLRAPLYLWLIFFSSQSFSQANCPTKTIEVNYGTGIAIDGDTSDWNRITDFFANMHEAGDTTKDLLAKAYVRYDCENEIFNVLVQMEPNVPFDSSDEDSWVRLEKVMGPPVVDGTDSPPDGSQPNFQYTANGFEASFSLNKVVAPDDTVNAIEIHINSPAEEEPGDSRTVSTGKLAQSTHVCYRISCSDSPPDPGPDPEPDPDPAVSMNKNDNDNNDDTQSVSFGDPADFSIKIRNTGEDTLINVVVSDALTSDCDTTITAKFAPGDSICYTCQQSSVSGSFINKAVVNAEGLISGTGVMDMDTTEVLLSFNPPSGSGFTITNTYQGDDPCECNNDQSANGAGDGTFTETVTITSTTTGDSLFVGPGSTPDSLIGRQFEEVMSSMVYELTFRHVDRIGFDFNIVDQNGATILNMQNNPLTISNVCKYPVINEPTIFPLCSLDAAFDLRDFIDNTDGVVTVMLTPPMGSAMVDSLFDPSTSATGTYTVEWIFDQDSTGSANGTVNNPACPGCITRYSTTFNLDDVCQPAVPTLSEWGLICLTLFLLIFGVLGVKQESLRGFLVLNSTVSPTKSDKNRLDES